MVYIKKFGWPRVIIAAFLLVLFMVAPFFGINLVRSFSDVITRFGMNAILVLSLIFMIQSGCGLNFGLPVGLIAGMLGAVISLEFYLTGLMGILAAVAIAMFFALIFGGLYGALLNQVKGDEMIIATYVGYSFVAFMNIMWIVLPFRNPSSVQGFNGEGLRTTIDLSSYWDKAISYFPFKINITETIVLPVGMLLLFALMSFLVWLFFKTKLGTAMTAVGSNPDYARASGINVNRVRLYSVMMSSAVAALGMIIYEQSFGFVQMFNAPQAFAFPAVASILLGGASINKSTIINVLVGAFLFQGIVTMTPSVINGAINIDISEVLRLIISYGMIVYALTRKE
ncbi:MAG: ABC transporter permease [Clostridiales bacterium]|jgi:simple sugar transport system permease protein|nr:ABC transporter permease [Clostridiales bacterium]